MPLLHNDISKERLGQRYIAVTFDWTKHNGGVASISEKFLKMYRSNKIKTNIGPIEDHQSTLSNNQIYVFDICTYHFNENKKCENASIGKKLYIES